MEANDTALLILRLTVGLYLMGHGAQKLFGWFKGGGPAGTVAMTTRLGFRPPQLWAAGLSLSETGGGLLVVVGLLGPVGPLAIAAAMAVAIRVSHWGKGAFNHGGGFELPLVYLLASASLVVSGPGAYSVDDWLGIALPEPGFSIAATVMVVLVVLALFGTRRRPVAVPQPT